jgi:hypothetical protein
MWFCTNWTYDANEVAAWGTWAAVVVALGAGFIASIRSWFHRRVEGRLLAALLYHEVAHADAAIKIIADKVMPEDGGLDMAETFLTTFPDLRREVAFYIKAVKLPTIEDAAIRLSLLPTKAAVAVVELHSNVSFLHQAESLLELEADPPSEFILQLRANVRSCVESAREARKLLHETGFPEGRLTRDGAVELDEKARTGWKSPKNGNK